jgi:hypothetical protein
MAHTALAYVISGQGKFAEKIAEPDQLVIFSSHDTKDTKISQESETIEFTAEGKQPLSVLLIAGQPINEPIARYGPFVMNYQAEIKQALVDYQEGRMGQISNL